MINSEELTGTTEYLTLQTRYRISRCRYKRVRLYLDLCDVLLYNSACIWVKVYQPRGVMLQGATVKCVQIDNNNMIT